MRFLLIPTLAVIPTSGLSGQNPGQRVNIEVGVAAISTNADTTALAYLVSNQPASTEPLWVFYVDAPAGVLRMTASTGSLRWMTGTEFGERPMAGWMFLHSYLAPGATTPELQFSSVGLPGIRTFWAGGYYALTEGGDELVTDSTVLADPFVTEMITGQTVGVDPWPSNRSAQALLARLRALTQSTCTAPTNWITGSGLCSQLVAHLDQAETYRSTGQTAQAADALLQYQTLLSTGRTAGTVKSSAYWLLKANAEIITGIL